MEEDRRIWVAETGCIGCRMCERNCPTEAMSVVEKQAAINYDLCISCGMCATKCPKNVIHDMVGIYATTE